MEKDYTTLQCALCWGIVMETPSITVIPSLNTCCNCTHICSSIYMAYLQCIKLQHPLSNLQNQTWTCSTTNIFPLKHAIKPLLMNPPVEPHVCILSWEASWSHSITPPHLGNESSTTTQMPRETAQPSPCSINCLMNLITMTLQKSFTQLSNYILLRRYLQKYFRK